MKDKTKKIIANVVVAIIGLYGLVGLVYLLPILFAAVSPIAFGMGAHFILIPVAALMMILLILTPFAFLIIMVVLIEWGMYKILGLKIDW